MITPDLGSVNMKDKRLAAGPGTYVIDVERIYFLGYVAATPSVMAA